MKLFVLMIGWAVVACVTSPEIRIQESKTLGYHFDLEKKKTMQQPYVARFKKGDKELFYLLSKHVSEKEYPRIVDHPTNLTIKRLFENFKPQVVIVEGIPSAEEISPLQLQERFKKCVDQEFKGCGESYYAMHQAFQSGAEHISGEPSEKQILDFVALSGFTEVDVLGFYMVRQIPQMKRRNEFGEKTFPKDCQRFLDHYRQRIGMTSKFGYLDFKNWYEKHMQKPKSFLDVVNDDPAPHGGGDATYVQRISHQVGLARDRVIVKRIEEMMNKYDRVLIVYGGSHYLLQEDALKDALGEPTFFKEIEP